MVIGIGMDLIEIARVGRAMRNDRFLDRIYTGGERERIAAKGAAGIKTAAGYLAAKEAAAKALGTGFKDFMPWDVEVVAEESGRPSIRLHRGAAARMEALGGARILLAITHDGDKASAFALIEAD